MIISCLDDFGTLRRMMGYCIIGFILKASMTLEEIVDVLNRTRQYLVNIRWMAMMTNNGKIADSIVMLTKIITPVFRNPGLTWKIRDELEFLVR